MTSGVTPAFGEPVGDAAGLGLATTTGDGLAGGFGGSGFGCSHAAEMAVAIASTVVRTIDLLIVFLLLELMHGPGAVRWQTSAAGLTRNVFPQSADKALCHSSSTLRG